MATLEEFFGSPVSDPPAAGSGQPTGAPSPQPVAQPRKTEEPPPEAPTFGPAVSAEEFTAFGATPPAGIPVENYRGPGVGIFKDVPQGPAIRIKPEKMPLPFSPAAGAVAMAARIFGEFGRGFVEPFIEGGSFGLGDESRQALAASGFFRLDGRDSFGNPMSTVRAFNELVIGGGTIALDFLGRIVEGGLRGTARGFAQEARELGASEGSARRLKRDVYGLGFSALIVSGATAIPSVPRAPRGLTGRKAAAPPAKRSPELLAAEAKFGPPLNATVERVTFSFMDKAKTMTLDRLHPLKASALKVAKETDTPPDLVPYISMRLIAGARGVIEAVQKRGTVKRLPDGDVGFRGASLNKVLEPIRGNPGDAALYFAGRRARELQSQGREKLFTPAEIKAMVDLEKANPEFSGVFTAYQKFNSEVLDFARQSGVLNAQTQAAFQRAGTAYVPFYRIIADAQGIKLPSGSGGLFRRLKGGESNVNEIWDNIARNTVMWTELSVRNNAKLQVYDWIDKHGMTNLAKKIPSSKVTFARTVDDNIEAMLKAMEPDLLKGARRKDPSLIPVLTSQRPMGKNIDMVFRNGKREFYEIQDRYMLEAMHAFTPRSVNLGIRVLGGFSNTLRFTVTTTPTFQVRNLVRDTQIGFALSKSGFIPGSDSLRGLASRMFKDDNYWLFMANGGGFSSTLSGELATGSKLSQFYLRAGIDPRKVLTSPRHITDAWEEVIAASEMGTRLGEFRRLRKKGMGAREAAFEGREITTDFALRGASETMQNIAIAVPFWNARLQGLSRIGREVREHPSRLALKGFVGITVPTLALYLHNKDKAWYQRRPDWVKDQHWLIPNPFNEDEPYLIPRGFEFGAMFAAVPERIFEAIETRNGKRFTNAMLRMFLETLSLDPTPHALKPVLEAGSPFAGKGGFTGFNRSMFTGRRVVPPDLEALRPSEQFRPWTSETLREMSKFLREDANIEMSPRRVEHLMRGYLGTLGIYALDAADWIVRGATDTPARPTPRLDKMPLIRGFFSQSPVRGSQFETDFYDLLTASREVASTVSALTKKQGRDPQLRPDEERLFGIRNTLSNVAAESSRLNRVMQQVFSDKSMSSEKKRTILDEIRTIQNDLFEGIMRGLPENILRERGLLVPSKPQGISPEEFMGLE